MKFGPKRGHVLLIFERFFRDFGLLLAAAALYLILRDSEILLQNSGLLVIAFIAPVARLFQYLTTYYTIDDEQLIIESGLFQKRRKEVPLSKIHTVDFTQTLIFQLAGVYSVHVDTASSLGTGNAGQVKMVLKEKDAVFAKKLLLSKENPQKLREDRISEDSSGDTIMASLGELLLMGLLRSKFWIMIQMFTYAGIAISILEKLFMNREVDGEQALVSYMLHLSAPMLLLFLALGLYLAGVLISTALNVVRYYGFRVTNREASIFVEYGLFTRKTFTLMKETVSGVSFRQSLFMRFGGRGMLEVFAAGYGDGKDENDQQEAAILYPALKKEKLAPFLKHVLPELANAEEMGGTQPKALPCFFLCARFCLATVFLVSSILAAALKPFGELPFVSAGLAGAGVCVFLLAAGSVVLEYTNTALSANERVVALTRGGFSKETVFLKTDKIEIVESIASLWKRKKKGIAGIRLGVLAPTRSARHKVRNLETEVFETVKDKLMY